MAEEKVDVLIVGSGHSGGMAAKILTEKGISCLMLNAGPVADVHKDTEPKPAYALPFRGFSQPGRLPHVFQSNEFNATPAEVLQTEFPPRARDRRAGQLS